MIATPYWCTYWKLALMGLNLVCLVIALLLFMKSKKRESLHEGDARYSRILGVCGLIFVAVALYRSVFMARYGGRLAWFDTVFCSPFVIRCLACLAEISFIGMIATILIRQDKILSLSKSKASLLAKTPCIAFCCIALAQFCAFSSLITQISIFLVIEESLWAAAFLSITPIVFIGLSRTGKKQAVPDKKSRVFFIVMALWCAGYSLYQCLYALPFNYFPRMLSNLAWVVPAQALKQAIVGYTVTRDLSDYGGIGFIIWFTGYFSICVWMTLVFMTAPGHESTPPLREEQKAG
ncbi:MAG: hypothetical protein FWE66_04410 [Oscillospiraceae bacterium]|nr:hypothetical protein [Oscillospiraceae bacterium]